MLACVSTSFEEPLSSRPSSQGGFRRQTHCLLLKLAFKISLTCSKGLTLAAVTLLWAQAAGILPLYHMRCICCVCHIHMHVHIFSSSCCGCSLPFLFLPTPVSRCRQLLHPEPRSAGAFVLFKGVFSPHCCQMLCRLFNIKKV